MRVILTRLLTLLLAACVQSTAMAADPGSPTFLLKFDSTQVLTGDGTTISSRVLANFVLEPVEGELGRYRGQGRLRYIELVGMAAVASDGVLTITDMRVSSENGTVTLDLFPGEPKPVELLIIPPVTAIKQFQWWSGFGLFHEDELGQGGFSIDNWQYPVGEVYARKTYSRNMTIENADFTESTTIELTPVPDPPRIDVINIESKGSSADDPETGEILELSADLYVPFLFEIERCTWTGNNFTGPGTGDVDDSCRWTYKPKEGKGPERDTYGKKDLKLTVVYRYGARQAAVLLSKSKDYKVFFTKKGDDDSDGDPNWFDYWGDDGAVPGLDGPDIDYDGSQGSFGYYWQGKVFMGPIAADSDGTLVVPQNPICVGGTFPGSNGIDIAAVTLAHELKHKETSELGGTDTDSDGVPDSAEAGTSISDPDSCNLAVVIDPDYLSYGDDEFIARLAEPGVSGVANHDWALPGRQASAKSAAVSSINSSSNGVVHVPQLATAMMLSSQSTIQAASLAGNGLLTGVYSATGQDPGGDGLFTSLRLDVGLSIVESDHYSVIAWLADDLGTELAWARAEADLGPGGTTLQLVFDGPALKQAGVAQPFVVSRAELYYRVGKHSVLADSAQNVLTTGHGSSAFKPPAATLAGVSAELPVDSDFDGLYNRLDITVDLDTYAAGEYEVSAQLRGATLALAGSQTVVVADGVASAQATLGFDGSSVFFNREDGPFHVTSLQVREVSTGLKLDFQADAWTTAAFPFISFQHSGVVIEENSYADEGGPLDTDGKHLSLDLMFAVSSMASGPYTVSASLEDTEGRTIAKASSVIGLGGAEGAAEMSQVMLSFDAKDIFAAGVDGPYQVAGVTVFSDGGIVMDQNPTPWMTAAYSADDFGMIPVTEEIFLDGFE